MIASVLGPILEVFFFHMHLISVTDIFLIYLSLPAILKNVEQHHTHNIPRLVILGLYFTFALVREASENDPFPQVGLTTAA